MEARSVDPKYRHNTHISASMLRRGEKFDRYEWLVERSTKFAGTVRIKFFFSKDEMVYRHYSAARHYHLEHQPSNLK